MCVCVCVCMCVCVCVCVCMCVCVYVLCNIIIFVPYNEVPGGRVGPIMIIIVIDHIVSCNHNHINSKAIIIP